MALIIEKLPLKLLKLTTDALFCYIVYPDRTHLRVLQNLENACYFCTIFIRDKLHRSQWHQVCTYFLLQYVFLFMLCYQHD